MRIGRLDHLVPGAPGPMRSLHIREPDRNLIEISVYEPGTEGEDN